MNTPRIGPLALILFSSFSLGNTLCFAGNDIHIDQRHIDFKDGNSALTISEPTFRDGAGREVHFRGWNVSGSVKLASRGFKPFASTEDARRSFESMKRHTGANLVRFTVSWEGNNPRPGEIDYGYAAAITEQIREAVRQQIYVFIDFHTDLYSRYLFQQNSPHTGNGAPQWIIDGGSYPKSNCGPFCFAWSQNIITNPAVRLGYRNFFDNAPVKTDVGETRVQDAFLWQMGKLLEYIKAELSAEEFQWVVGVQPFNEPIYGRGHNNRASEFDNEKLWPFYKRSRAVADQTGWGEKWIFAEPMVFWDTNVGFFTPATGGHYLKEKVGKGFVFAPHFYDAARMGVSNLGKVQNGEYFQNLDRVREEGRFLGIPTVLGEFGMWLKDQKGGARDHARIVNATYQAMEASDSQHSFKDRRPDFYTATVSGTQWHWDINKDNHFEYQNGNPKKLMTKGDGWNGEDFSVIRGDELVVDARGVQRAYPRAVDGNTVSFYFNALPVDGAGKTLEWAEIRTGGESFLGDRRFALLVWQGGGSADTELFLPTDFLPESTSLITERYVYSNLGSAKDHALADVRYVPEFNRGLTGYRLLISGDGAVSKKALHFALVVNDSLYDDAALRALQSSLVEQINHHEHPVFLRGRMAGLNYPSEAPNENPHPVALSASEEHFLLFRWISLQWKASGDVTVFQKGKPILSAGREGSSTVLSLLGAKDTFSVCEQADTSRCSRTLTFD
ncbi:Putative endoglycosylceramidase [gamma proteobacterium HdN1]|nr:Putative endoglycosylceramidase [gamma proteobacterium HdN1]